MEYEIFYGPSFISSKMIHRGKTVEKFSSMTVFDSEKIFGCIKDFLKCNNIQFHYFRGWEENGRIVVDFGSWTNFIFIKVLDD